MQVDWSRTPNFLTPRSPDLTPWGFIKDIVYATKPRNIPELMDKIVTTVQVVTPCMLSKVHDEMERRLHLCITQGGMCYRKTWLTTLECRPITHKNGMLKYEFCFLYF
ncbi:hypothetical protein C0J52_16857 [Blattella germanica]|nr:hypothetical protein C0J52_16857 [Blattella germanica]